MKRLISILIAAIFSLLGIVASSVTAAPVPTATTTQIIGYDAASNSFNVTFDAGLGKVGFGPILEESAAARVGEFSAAPAVFVAADTAGDGYPAIKAGSSSGGPTAGQKFPGSVRQEELGNNPSTCVYCHMDTDSPQVDHVIPRSRGGNATIDNAQTTCAHCNAS